jgi:hypothetical protein
MSASFDVSTHSERSDPGSHTAPRGGRSDAPRLYLSAGKMGPEPAFLVARFSLRRCLSVFCGFCLCCFLGLSELLLTTTSDVSAPLRNCSKQRELAPQVESCSPEHTCVSRATARREVPCLRPGFWQQGQVNHPTPLSPKPRSARQAEGSAAPQARSPHTSSLGEGPLRPFRQRPASPGDCPNPATQETFARSRG